MTVIPLILTGTSRTVTAQRHEFSAEGELVLIEELDSAQFRDAELSAQRGSNVSYDFRVGAEYRDHRESGRKTLGPGDKITIVPQNAVIVETRERVWLPRSRFGAIVPKVGLLQQGLSNTTSKIDPGYNGRLLITVFNLGKQTVELSAGQAFCTLYVLQVAQGARLYGKPEKQIDDKPGTQRVRRMIDWMEGHSVWFSILALIASTLVLLVQLYASLRGGSR